MSLRTPAAVLIAVILILPAAASATNVQTGIDPVEHFPPSWWDFGPAPLPADFFGPGSDPFDGGVPADAKAMGSTPDCPGELGNTSMLIERKDTALLPAIPSSDVINVEIIAMSLVSADPITVTYFGGTNPELWNVEITLSPSLTSIGTMTIRKEHANGGTFDAAIYLQPHFTFTRVSDSETRTLDGAGMYEDLIEALGVPWVYADPHLACPSCVTNFIPGHDGVNPIDYALTGVISLHTVRCSCAYTTAIPTLSQWGTAIALIALLILGVYAIVRHRRIAGIRIS
jgi:hypothetical protein